MNARRFIGSLLATTLTATTLGVVATAAAPASAATVVATKVVMQVSYKKTEYRRKISVSGSVQGQSSDGSWGTLPYGSGSVTLQFLPRGGNTWQSLQSDDQGYSFYFYPVVAKRTGTYRVVYNGGTYEDYQFAGSSSTKGLKVERKLNYKEVPGRRAGIQGKIGPAAKVRIKVYKKVGKKFRAYKSVRTTKRGGFKIILPAPRNGRWYWKIVFPGSKAFVPSIVKGNTYSY